MVMHTMQRSPAWLAASGTAVKLLLHLMMLSKGNNGFGDDKRDRGRLFLSERQAAKLIGVTKNTAARALRELIDLGFLRVMEKGHYDVKGVATTWRLTFQPYPHGSMAPTNEWRRWGEQNAQAQKLTGIGSETDQPTHSHVIIGSEVDPISPKQANSIGSITAPHIYLPQGGVLGVGSDRLKQDDLGPQNIGGRFAASGGRA
jgi:hypothetical protein